MHVLYGEVRRTLRAVLLSFLPTLQEMPYAATRPANFPIHRAKCRSLICNTQCICPTEGHHRVSELHEIFLTLA